MHHSLYQSLLNELTLKYDNFPQDTQGAALALAEIMHIPRALVTNATPEMVEIMAGVMMLKSLTVHDKKWLQQKISSYLNNTKSANYQRFGGTMRYYYGMVANRDKSYKLPWSLTSNELESAVSTCGWAENVGLSLNSSGVAITLYKAIRKKSLPHATNAIFFVLIGTQTHRICEKVYREEKNRPKIWR